MWPRSRRTPSSTCIAAKRPGPILASALSDFCVVPGGLLAHVATEFLDHPDSQATGWIGLGPALEFVGEIKGDEATHALDVRLGGGAAFTQPIRATLQDERRLFQFKLPQLLPGAALHVSCRGVALLGSGLRIPSEFALDGRAAADDRLISGWARIGWMPSLPVHLCVEDEDGIGSHCPFRKSHSRAHAGLSAQACGSWGFAATACKFSCRCPMDAGSHCLILPCCARRPSNCRGERRLPWGPGGRAPHAPARR